MLWFTLLIILIWVFVWAFVSILEKSEDGPIFPLCKELERKSGTYSFTLYAYSNKLYLPIGIGWYNRYAHKNARLYYKHLIEISIGLFCFRFKFQWWK